MKCPICNYDKSQEIISLDCGNFDQSNLYNIVKIICCMNCGHLFNKLNEKEIENLSKYYNEDYAQTNPSLMDSNRDIPGSKNTFSIKRYEQILDLLSPHINKDSRILDIGCALGGFLDFLGEKGYTNLYGIDFVSKYVENSNNENIKVGNAYSIPFPDNSFEVVVLSQVFEHIVDLQKAIKEIKRVLVAGGLCYIGVPNASKYNEFFPFYWFLLREHVQHFDLNHLKLLATKNSFELIDYKEVEIPMLSENMILPNLMTLFRLDDSKFIYNIGRYLNKQFELMKKKKELINELIVSKRPVYVWGLGREFLYLWGEGGLKYCNIVALIDDTPLKRYKFTKDCHIIRDYTALYKAPKNSVLIITAIAHKELLKNRALKMKFKGEIIDV